MDARAEIALSTWRRFVLTGLVTCLCFAAPAAAATNAVSPSFVASSVAGKPVTVTIDASGPGTWAGSSVVGGNQVFLGEQAYRDAARGGGVGVFLLLHETAHTTGIADERAADCFSLTHIKSVLRRFWPFRPAGIAQRYGEALSWPAKYDGNNCSATAARRAR